MPALNFKAKFAALVESGKKQQTIRLRRVRPIEVGDTLYLKTGMRTPHCRAIGAATCTGIESILIASTYIMVDNHRLAFWEMSRLAADDGFDSIDAFVEFFRNQYGLPFRGVIISWKEPPPC